MFKKIHTLILAGALTLPAAPAALAGYKEYCLNNDGAYTAAFSIEVVKRGPPSAAAAGKKISSKGRGGVLAAQTKCVSARDAGVRPGDFIRFHLNPDADIGSKGSRHCGANGKRNRNFEGGFLVPDGPEQGRFTIKSWGHLYGTRCEVEHVDSERMHSACGATARGMENLGCNRFELDFPGQIGHGRGNTLIPDMAAENVEPGRFFDLLARGHNINQRHRDGSTATHIAARDARGPLLDILIQRGADLDLRTDDGSTALMQALVNRRFEMATRLILGGANPNFAREDGEFPLRFAAEQGTAEMVKLLLDNGALVNAVQSETGQTAIAAASGRRDAGRNAVVDLLASYGAINRIHVEVIPNLVATDSGVSRLEEALEDGADANESTGDGLTGLHIAAMEGFGQYVDKLLNFGADPNLQDRRGRTPLMTALEARSDESSVVLSLVFGGADPNLARADGNFPLYLAVENGDAGIVEALLFADGIEVNARHPDSGKTSLKLADELFERHGNSAYKQIQNDLLNNGAGR